MANDTKFKPGWAGGPGRPKGSVCGRKKALAVLDAVLGDENNLKLLKEHLIAQLEKNPTEFFLKMGYPLMPKDATLSVTDGDGEGIILNVQINGSGNTKCES